MQHKNEVALIKRVKFDIITQEELRRLSCLQILTNSLAQKKNNTLLDERLGTTDSKSKCPSCSNNADICGGHFGFIDLKTTILNPFFSLSIIKLFKLICFDCLEEKNNCTKIHCATESLNFNKEHGFVRGKGNKIKINTISDKILKISETSVWKNVQLKRDPKDYLIKCLVVPPTKIRPSNKLNSVRFQDESTVHLQVITKQVKSDHIDEESLFDNIANFMCNDFVSKSKGRSSHSFESKCISSRWKGKKGRLRGNLMGKRINYTARTVISPAPDLKINEVGVPYEIAEVLTKPVLVTFYNINLLQDMVNRNDKSIKFVKTTTGHVFNRNISNGYMPLRVGYVIEKTLKDGDWVILNRQPTLSKYSFMAHKVKIMNNCKTLTLNLSTTPSYNADFDGDEMNVHCIRGVEADLEAELIVNVEENIVGSQGNANIYLVQDSILGVYFLTMPTTVLNQEEVFDILYDHIDKIPPSTSTNEKGNRVWRGADVFSVLIPDFYSFSSSKEEIIKGKIAKGPLTKKTLGKSNEGIVYRIAVLMGNKEAAAFINSAQQIARRFIDLFGASVVPKSICSKNEMKTNKFLKTLDNYTENIDMQIPTLSKLLNDMGSQSTSNECNDVLEAMVISGSKGNSFNLTQIRTCVGQQSISGASVKPNYGWDRVIPSITNKNNTENVGFIRSNYRQGLNQTEYFLHMVSGREGVIDTSVKTADTGYLHRKLTKTLESFSLCVDGTVRGHGNTILQFEYGSDSLQASVMYDSINFTKTDDLTNNRKKTKTTVKCHNDFFNEFFGKYKNLKFKKICVPLNSKLLKDLLVCQKKHLCVRATVGFLHKHLLTIKKKLKKEWLVNVFAFQIYQIIFGDKGENTNTKCREKILSVIKFWYSHTLKSLCQSGEMVGMYCVGSIGEPCTQMTLNTFHSCGIENETVNKGIPRLKDIIDARSTGDFILGGTIQSLAVYLCCLRRLKFQDVLSVLNFEQYNLYKMLEDYVKLVLGWKKKTKVCVFMYRCHLATISELVIQKFYSYIKEICRTCRYLIKLNDIGDSILVVAEEGKKKCIEALVKLDIVNVPNDFPIDKSCSLSPYNWNFNVHTDYNYALNINESTIYKFVETGYTWLLDIVFTRCMHMAKKIWGMESTVLCIFKEILAVMGDDVMNRHILAIADVMTVHGSIKAFHRYGLQGIKSVSPLEQATFEQTIDVFRKAASERCENDVYSISDNIIVGKKIQGGTNSFELRYPQTERTIDLHNQLSCKEENGEDISNASSKPKKYIKTFLKPDWCLTEKRKSWDDKNQHNGDVLSCPSSPMYCPLSPEYAPSSPLFQNTLITNSEQIVYSKSDFNAIETMRKKCVNEQGFEFKPPSPTDKNGLSLLSKEICFDYSLFEDILF